MCRHSRTPREIEEIKKNWEKAKQGQPYPKGTKMVHDSDPKNYVILEEHISDWVFRDTEGFLRSYLSRSPAQSSCAKGLEEINGKLKNVEELLDDKKESWFNEAILVAWTNYQAGMAEYYKDVPIIKKKPMKSKTYILLKDLPDVKAGAEFTMDFGFYQYGKYTYYKKDVETNPEWFKLKDEKEFTESQMMRMFDLSDCGSVEYLLEVIRKENNP